MIHISKLEELRQNKTYSVFISCNTPAHAFRLDLKNEQSELYCIWIEDEDGVYQTSCLHSFEFIDGTPESNHMKFCPYCGKPIGRQTSHTPQYDGYRQAGE